MKYQFELIIKSTNTDVVLKYNPTIKKWEAVSLSDMKILARRKNVGALVDALNGVNSTDAA